MSLFNSLKNSCQKVNAFDFKPLQHLKNVCNSDEWICVGCFFLPLQKQSIYYSLPSAQMTNQSLKMFSEHDSWRKYKENMFFITVRRLNCHSVLLNQKRLLAFLCKALLDASEGWRHMRKESTPHNYTHQSGRLFKSQQCPGSLCSKITYTFLAQTNACHCMEK